ncbi:hypothetical protein [Micromonospora avicenniae]|uniref:hypothetical protein n=1 Tax=Micromonospora avicenniae TaxID=1198245 RepID=UPI003330729D
MRQLRPPMAALLLAGLLPLLVGSVAGCGSGGDDVPPAAVEAPLPEAPATSDEPSPTTQAPAAVDACALVTKKEAEELAGTKLDDAVPVRESCTYTAPAGGPTAQVEVFVGDGAKKYLDIERELGHELRPLAGVGDETYVSFEAAFVNRSGLWVAVRLVRLNDPEENREPLERIAGTVAGRI